MFKPANSKKEKYIIYARISERGSGWNAQESTIPMQIELCKKWVEDYHGGVVCDVISDERKSDAPDKSRFSNFAMKAKI